MPKRTSSAKKKPAAKARRRGMPRAAPLAIAEPRLSVPRTAKTKRVPAVEKPEPTTPDTGVGSFMRLMFAWSPMSIALRQQAILASMLSVPTFDETSSIRTKAERRKA